MIRGSMGRFLTLVLAPLVVIAVTAVVMLPRRGDDTVKVSADGPSVTLVEPQNNTRRHVEPMAVVAKVTDPDGLALAELRIDGKRQARETLSGGSDDVVRFTWEPSKPGEFEVSVRARDLNGSWGAAARATVRIESDEVALPAPPSTSAAGSTAAETTQGVVTEVVTSDATTLAPDTTSANPDDPDGLAPLFPLPTRPPATPATVRPNVTPGTPGTNPTLPEPATVPITQPPTTIPPCVSPTPSITTPRSGTTGVSTTPLVAWAIPGLTCTLIGQELRVTVPRTDIYNRIVRPATARYRVPLGGTVRSQTTPALPVCTRVTVQVLAYDDLGIRGSNAKTFETTLEGCPPLPTTTTTEPPTTTTTTTEPPTTTTTTTEPPTTTTTTTEPPTTTTTTTEPPTTTTTELPTVPP